MPRPTRPAHGATGWDTYLEAVFDDVYTRSAPLRQAFLDGGVTPISSGGAASLHWVPWAGIPGDGIDLFDLTDPTQPRAIRGGVYAISGFVHFFYEGFPFTPPTTGKFWTQLDVDWEGFDPYAQVESEARFAPSTGCQISLPTVTSYVPAGGIVYASAGNLTDVDIPNAELNAWVTLISTTD